MTDSLPIECPHCGESFTVAFDAGEGNSEFVVDCEICCRPMTVTVRLRDGEIETLDVAAA
jgi:transcription elongation factor Elf1